jgi:hypothetical protein
VFRNKDLRRVVEVAVEELKKVVLRNKQIEQGLKI